LSRSVRMGNRTMIAPRNLPSPASLLGIVLVTAAASVSIAQTTVPRTSGRIPAESQNVAVFTGKFADGMPVYRLPSMDVVGHRKVELAKAQREQQPRDTQVRARAVARPPA